MKKRILSVLLIISLLFTLSSSTFALTPSFGKDWNVKSESINPEIRPVGNIIRSLVPSFTEGLFDFANFFIDNFLCGMNLALRVKYEEKYITREDGSKLRLCVYSPKEKKSDVPGLLWIHGGGYALGAPEQDFSFI